MQDARDISVANLAERVAKAYLHAIELRPNDLASPRPARRTDDLLRKLDVNRATLARGSDAHLPEKKNYI